MGLCQREPGSSTVNSLLLVGELASAQSEDQFVHHLPGFVGVAGVLSYQVEAVAFEHYPRRLVVAWGPGIDRSIRNLIEEGCQRPGGHALAPMGAVHPVLHPEVTAVMESDYVAQYLIGVGVDDRARRGLLVPAQVRPSLLESVLVVGIDRSERRRLRIAQMLEEHRQVGVNYLAQHNACLLIGHLIATSLCSDPSLRGDVSGAASVPCVVWWSASSGRGTNDRCTGVDP